MARIKIVLFAVFVPCTAKKEQIYTIAPPINQDSIEELVCIQKSVLDRWEATLTTEEQNLYNKK